MRGARIALIIGLLGCALANADPGYWRCREGHWQAVGAPAHPRPLKECGKARQRPNSQEDCVRQGGRWGPIGIFPTPVCSLPTRDAGRPCADSDECEGLCVAKLSPEERERLMRNRGPDSGPGLVRPGACTPRIPVVGCQPKMEQGRVRYLICLD